MRAGKVLIGVRLGCSDGPRSHLADLDVGHNNRERRTRDVKLKIRTYLGAERQGFCGVESRRQVLRNKLRYYE